MVGPRCVLESGQFYATREIPDFRTCFQILFELDWHWSSKQDSRPWKPKLATLSSFWKWPCYRLVIGWFRYKTQIPFCISTINSHLYTKTLWTLTWEILTQLMQTRQCFKLSHKVKGQTKTSEVQFLWVKTSSVDIYSYLQIPKSSRRAWGSQLW